MDKKKSTAKKSTRTEGGEFYMDAPYATNYEIHTLNEHKNEVRVYCHQFPDNFNFQIRTFKPTNGCFGRGKPRKMIATVSITIEEVREMLRYMEDSKGREDAYAAYLAGKR